MKGFTTQFSVTDKYTTGTRGGIHDLSALPTAPSSSRHHLTLFIIILIYKITIPFFVQIKLENFNAPKNFTILSTSPRLAFFFLL